MIDFFFAVIAAGVNAAGDTGSSDSAAAFAKPAPTAEVAEAAPLEEVTPTPTTPTVSMGEGVIIGSGSVIAGGSLLGGTRDSTTSAATGGGLLDGTSETATAIAPAPADNGFNMSVVPAGLTADPQDPTGKFTTAAEVKPILTATKGNWVAVREYDGKDLLYVTHLWGWRCGLKAMAISVNGEAMQNWPLPECHMKYSTPNAMLEEDGLPYLSLRLGAVQTIDIQIVYDDLSMDAASFARGDVSIP